jgi:hypothetical protein
MTEITFTGKLENGESETEKDTVFETDPNAVENAAQQIGQQIARKNGWVDWVFTY